MDVFTLCPPAPLQPWWVLLAPAPVVCLGWQATPSQPHMLPLLCSHPILLGFPPVCYGF